jgi:VanZ family protein
VTRVSVARWAPAALWVAVIATLDSVPHPERITPRTFEGFDKIVHFSLYAILAVLVHRAVMSTPSLRATRSALVSAFLAITALAALDEWHQHFIPGRSEDPTDWLADTAGASVGLMIADLARRRREPST